MTIKLPGSKIRDLRRSIRQVLAYPSPTPRKIHSIIMRTRSATSSVFLTDLYTQALTRYKNQTVKYESHWDKPLKLPTECVQELAWWENLQKWNGRFLMNPSPEETIYVDASDRGWEGVYGSRVAQVLWPRQDPERSINWRELKAIHHTLWAFPDVKNVSILIPSDDITAKSYRNEQDGTRSLTLWRLATQIWELCLRRDLTIQAQHIPGRLNHLAY